MTEGAIVERLSTVSRSERIKCPDGERMRDGRVAGTVTCAWISGGEDDVLCKGKKGNVSNLTIWRTLDKPWSR